MKTKNVRVMYVYSLLLWLACLASAGVATISLVGGVWMAAASFSSGHIGRGLTRIVMVVGAAPVAIGAAVLLGTLSVCQAQDAQRAGAAQQNEKALDDL